jgi:hypothetical protein
MGDNRFQKRSNRRRTTPYAEIDCFPIRLLDESLGDRHQAAQPTSTAGQAPQSAQPARHTAQPTKVTEATKATTGMFFVISVTSIVATTTPPTMSSILSLQEGRQLDPKLPRYSS